MTQFKEYLKLTGKAKGCQLSLVVKKQNILILSSLGMNLKPLASRLRGARKIEADQRGIRTALMGEYQLILCKLGQGQKIAADVTAGLIEEFKPVHVFYIGLAGSLRQDIVSPSVFSIARIKSSSAESSTLAVSQVISRESVFDDSSPALVTMAKGKARVHRGSLLSVGYYSGGFKERKRLRKTGIDLLDIEAGAVAEVVAKAGVKFTCIMSVSDDTMERFPLYQATEKDKTPNPPPRKIIKAVSAAKVLASVTHMWLLRLCLPGK